MIELHPFLSSLIAILPSILPQLFITGVCIYFLTQHQGIEAILLVIGSVISLLIGFTHIAVLPQLIRYGTITYQKQAIIYSITGGIGIISSIIFGIGLLLTIHSVLKNLNQRNSQLF